MKSQQEIRESFFDFFRTKQHMIVPSAPVVPIDDPTLLFTNAGMNQFKSVFLGTGKIDYPRKADTQKCLRVSGKHNDLDAVGRDTYHHTFFEMLGNWSFGDYFKSEAISWAWEYLTRICGLEGKRLYATYFGGDAEDGTEPDVEARELWLKNTDIAEDHVMPFGKKDNFWEMGDVGPCGPCSEIHIDMGEGHCDRKHVEGHVCGVNGDCMRFMEIWNLVFIQYNRRKDRSLEKLPARHVDTGMGFERLTAILQGKYSNYDTDLFLPIFVKLKEITGVGYREGDEEQDVALRVVADHVKALCFAVADGAVPEKKGRGSVLRSLLRRAARFGRQVLGTKEPFIYLLPPVVGELYKDIFPEVSLRLEHICNVIKEEEMLFAETLDHGLSRFTSLIQSIGSGKKIDGFEAYRLYHQDGFPKDLIAQMAAEHGLEIDEEGWEKARQEHRERSKGEAREALFEVEELYELPASEFTGYWEKQKSQELGTCCTVRPLKLLNRKALVLDRTPFYAESGGQTGDQGVIEAPGFRFRVDDTQKTGDFIVHYGELEEGAELPGQACARVDYRRRRAVMAAHSATHLFHWALKQVVGGHADQHGSEVGPDSLRFDFTHSRPLTAAEIAEIERLVNEKILENAAVRIYETSLAEAKEQGITALFGEKYGETVRVVDMDGFSRELCGGTHVTRTGDIGLFTVLSESSSEAGVRRVEAVTGMNSLKALQADRAAVRQVSSLLSARPEEFQARIEAFQQQGRELKKLRAAAEKKDLSAYKTELLAKAREKNSVKIIAEYIREVTPAAAGELADELRSAPGVCGLILCGDDGSLGVVGFASKDLTGKVHMGNIVRQACKELGGGGGGRPDFAKGGGKDLSKAGGVLEKVFSQLEESI